MSKHTPGPWVNHGRVSQPGLPCSSIAAKTLIARVYSEAFGDQGQETANAHLIAAAPELLEAARAALHCIGELAPTQARVEAALLLQAAIAKAKGEA